MKEDEIVHTACTREKKHAYKFVVENIDGREPLGRVM
jgi:hypothetical protein